MQRTRKPVFINPFNMTAEDVRLIQMLAEDYHPDISSDSNIGIVKSNHTYTVTIDDFESEPEKQHIQFTHDVRLHPHTLIDPTNLNDKSRNLLSQLLSHQHLPDFIDCTDAFSRNQVTYHLVDKNGDFANLHLVQLTHSLIRFASTHHPDSIRYAVVKREAFAHGARHAIYLSKHTLLVQQRENNEIDIDCKRKIAKEKYRAVKRPYLPADDRKQIKVTEAGLLDRSEQNTRLQHEYKMMRGLSLFHVKPVVISTGNASPALIMRYVNGSELSEIYDQFNFEQRVKAAIMIGDAIAYLHANNLIHRDIKIENIIVTTDENNDPTQCTLIDLELTHKPNDKLALELAGTPGYIAPEILDQLSCGASFASDVYAYAVILKDYLFNRDASITEKHRIILDDICEQGLHANPAARASLQTLLQALRSLLPAANEGVFLKKIYL